MKKVFSAVIYEEGLRCDGFCELDTIERLFNHIEFMSKHATHPVKVILREHEIDHDCEICNEDSVTCSIRFGVINLKRKEKRND